MAVQAAVAAAVAQELVTLVAAAQPARAAAAVRQRPKNSASSSRALQSIVATHPTGDTAITADLPNEDGVPNRGGTGGGSDDNHDTITGSDLMGKWDGGPTRENWTSATGGDGPRVGHSWPAQSGKSRI